MDSNLWNHLKIRELEEFNYECWNCQSPTTETGRCNVCGTKPHQGNGWEIKCTECNYIEHGDEGDNIEHEMMIHRLDGCSDAQFKVNSL